MHCAGITGLAETHDLEEDLTEWWARIPCNNCVWDRPKADFQEWPLKHGFYPVWCHTLVPQAALFSRFSSLKVNHKTRRRQVEGTGNSKHSTFKCLAQVAPHYWPGDSQKVQTILTNLHGPAIKVEMFRSRITGWKYNEDSQVSTNRIGEEVPI